MTSWVTTTTDVALLERWLVHARYDVRYWDGRTPELFCPAEYIDDNRERSRRAVARIEARLAVIRPAAPVGVSIAL